MKRPLDTRGKRTGSTRGLALSVVMLLLFHRTALDLCASKASRSLICAARSSAKQQKDLSLGCFTEITSVATRLPLSRAAARTGGAPACEVNLPKINLTKTAVSGRITDFHCLRCSAAPAGAPAPLPVPARPGGCRGHQRAGQVPLQPGLRGDKGQPSPGRNVQKGLGSPWGAPQSCYGNPEPAWRTPQCCYETLLQPQDHLARPLLRYQSRCRCARRRAGIYSPGGPASSGEWLHAKASSNKHIGPTGSVSYSSNFPD